LDKKRKNHTLRTMVGVYFCLAGVLTQQYAPDLVPFVLGGGFAMVAWIARDFIRAGRELDQKRAEELRVQRIRELEKDLGYTPLELGDPTEPVRNEPEEAT